MNYPKIKMDYDVKNPPTYTGQDVNEYINHLNNYMHNVKTYKYNIVLDFINILLQKHSKKYKKISDFKSIEKSKILKRREHNIKMLRMYSIDISDKLNISYKTLDPDDDTVSDTEIINFLRKMLDKIDYVITKEEIEGDAIYYISERKYKKCDDD